MTHDFIDLRLSGTIKAVTPINISRIDDDPKKNRNLIKGVPQTTIVVGADSKLVPYIPGATFKGLLRALSGDLIRSITGQKLGFETYTRLYKGGIKEKTKESNDVTTSITERRKNPSFGLYGMGSPWVAGCAIFLEAVPTNRSDVAIENWSGARRDDFKLDPMRLLELDPEEVEAYQNQRSGETQRTQLNSRKKELEAELRKAKKLDTPESRATEERLTAEIEAVVAETTEIEAGNTVGRPLSHSSIARGSVFESRINVNRAFPEEVGLLLRTIEALQHNCRIGGLRGTGHGYFRGEWKLEVRRGMFEKFTPAGTLMVDDGVCELVSSHELVDQALAAWDARAADPSSLQIEGTAPAKKSGKKGAEDGSDTTEGAD